MATIAQLDVVIDAKLDKFRKEMKKGSKEFGDMEKSASSLGKQLGAVFLTGAAAIAIKRMSEMAGRAEGVRQAFERLNQKNLLANLKAATNNTVADLKLMQAAVKAQNFKIPLEQLATFFEFATKRATQTGESVDFLVDSLVNGIGRKSALVLDNLGISLTELQKEIKITGDFGTAAGAIIERELKNMGEVTLTTADKWAQLNTAIDNLSVTAGDFVNKGGSDLLTWSARFVTNLSAMLVEFDKLSKHPISRFIFASEPGEAFAPLTSPVDPNLGAGVRVNPLAGTPLAGPGFRMQGAITEGLDDVFFTKVPMTLEQIADLLRIQNNAIIKGAEASKALDSLQFKGGGIGVTGLAGFGDPRRVSNQQIIDTTRQAEISTIRGGIGPGVSGVAPEFDLAEMQEALAEGMFKSSVAIDKYNTALEESEQTQGNYNFAIGAATGALISLMTGALNATSALEQLVTSVLSSIVSGVFSSIIGSIIPGLDVGTPFVPRDMLAMVHKGEAVVPANMNPFGGGGGMMSGRVELVATGDELRGVLNENDSMRGTQS